MILVRYFQGGVESIPFPVSPLKCTMLGYANNLGDAMDADCGHESFDSAVSQPTGSVKAMRMIRSLQKDIK